MKVDVLGGSVVLGKRSSGALAVGVRTKSGAKAEIEVPTDSPRPTVEVTEGMAVVAGLFPDPKANRVEVLTDQKQVYQGSVRNGAYLIAWPSDSKPRLLLRILDAAGHELYRWPPASLPVA